MPRFLPGTENGSQPFWSPDSRMLGFFAEGQLKTVAIAGGTPTVLARSGLARGAAWSKDNLILFAPRPNAGLVVVPASGGEPAPVPTPPTIGIPGFPSFLPDGRHYMFTDLNNENRLVERFCSDRSTPRRPGLSSTPRRAACTHPGYLLLSAEHDAAGAPFR